MVLSLWNLFNFDLNKGWKKGKYYKQRRFDNDFMSVKVPWYELSQWNGQAAIIINGRQLIIKKLPKNKEYFIDKNLGMYFIKHDRSFFLNKCEVFFYDVRNQNPLDPGLTHELYKWANNQGLYKIRRVDVKHAIRLRAMIEGQKKLVANKKSQIKEIDDAIEKLQVELDSSDSMDSKKIKELEKQKTELEKDRILEEVKLENVNNILLDQLEAEKRATRRFIQNIRDDVKKENEETEKNMEKERGNPSSDEYHIKSEDEINYLITENLFNNGYIDEKQQLTLNKKLRSKEILTTDDLLNEIDSFTTKYVVEPISHELERLLDDYYTYNPRNIIMYISWLHKMRNGINKLRTKAVFNWFPSMYILFAAVGIIMFYMIWTSGTFSSVDPTKIIPGT